MTTADAVAFNAHEITEITQEKAYEIAETLTNKTKHDSGSMLIFRGLSAVYGMIYIAIPPLGNSLILPLAIQNAFS